MIKKVFQVTGLLVLTCISFMYTEKAMIVVREQDPLMIELMEKKESHSIPAINAYIDGNDIIPGYEGIEVDVELSYEKMKKYGLYNENMLIFKNVSPEQSINKIYNKYIVAGNKSKNMVSLVFNISKNDDIRKIKEILRKNNVVATFFFDKEYIEKNKEIIDELVSLGNEVGHKNYSNDEEMIYSNRLLDKKQSYCYLEKYNEDMIKLCNNYSMHAVKPIIVNDSISLKKNLSSGSIIGMKASKQINNELDHIIIYIKQKGLTLATLSDHLNEKRLEK